MGRCRARFRERVFFGALVVAVMVASTEAIPRLTSADEPQSMALRPSREYIHADGRTLAVVGAPPLVEFAGERAEGIEGEAPVTARVVVRTATGAPLPAQVVVGYRTDAGTASAGEDFVPASGTLTFEAGSPDGAERTATVELVNDTRHEARETLSLVLAGATGGVTGTAALPVSILDDDPPPVVSVPPVRVAEGNGGTVLAEIAFTLSSPSSLDAGFDYTTEDGTALAGSDYLAAAGTVTIPAGETVRTITVPILGDARVEPDESFTVRLLSPRHATLDVERVGVTIAADDLPRVGVADTLASEGEPRVPWREPGVAVFKVTLEAWAGPASVQYRTEDDTAVAGQDYVATTGTLVFDTPTPLVRTVRVPIIDDALAEGPERFRLVLHSPEGAVLGAAVAKAAISDDESLTPLPPPKPNPNPDADPSPQASLPPPSGGERWAR